MKNPLSTDLLAIAERWAAASSDRAKLLVLADAVAGIDVPALSNEALRDEVAAKVRALASWIAEAAVEHGSKE